MKLAAIVAEHPSGHASEAKRLRELERENARLKRLLAEAELDKSALPAATVVSPQQLDGNEKAERWRRLWCPNTTI
ncbi:MAG: hypothetical protein ACX93N_04755 [Pseudohaliea sp.]